MAKRYKHSTSGFLPDYVERGMLDRVAQMGRAFCDPAVRPFPITLDELKLLVWHPDAVAAHDMVAQYVHFPRIEAHPMKFNVLRDRWSGIDPGGELSLQLTTTLSQGYVAGFLPIFPAEHTVDLRKPVWGGSSPAANEVFTKLQEWAAFVAECGHSQRVVTNVLNRLFHDCSDLKQLRALLPSVSILLDDGVEGSAGSKLAEQARVYQAPSGLPAVAYKADLPAISGWITQGSMVMRALAESKSTSSVKPGGLTATF
jgi:hypothetical protein